MVARYEAKVKARAKLDEHHGSSAGAFIIARSIATVFIALIPLIGGLIGCPASEVGYARYNLHMVNNKKPKAIFVFDGFENTMQAIYLGLQKFFFILLWALTGAVLGLIGLICTLSSSLRVLGIIFLILAGLWTIFIVVYKKIQYSMGDWVLADDPTCSATTAFNISKQITAGHIWDLFVVDLTFVGWFILTMIFLPAILFVAPYYYATIANIYCELRGSKMSGDKDAPVMDAHRLECISGTYKGYVFEVVPNEEIIIGRDSDMAHIVLPADNDKISRKHCGIVFDEKNNKYGIIDYSKHGTYINNGVRISNGSYTWVEKGTIVYLIDRTNTFKLL